ncbi:tetratricopeptide repeat protein, partial [Streptomyces asiaticus]
GRTQHRMGHYTESETTLREVLRSRERILGVDGHPKPDFHGADRSSPAMAQPSVLRARVLCASSRTFCRRRPSTIWNVSGHTSRRQRLL